MFLILLFGVAYVALQYPKVQTKVAKKAAEYLSQTLEHEVTIEKVNIKFFRNVILEKVKVLDYRKQELFYLGSAEAEISLFSIFDPNTLHIGTLELNEPRANLVKYEGTDTLNLSTFLKALNKLIRKDPTKPKNQPFDFSIDEVLIHNGRFTYDDFSKAPAPNGIDYFHMTVDKLNGRFTELEPGDTLRARITDLRANETRSGTKLHNLDVRMTYAPTFWEFDELDLRVNQSHLQHYVRFDYDRFLNFRSFVDSVSVTANLKNTKVYSQDIAVFAPQLLNYDENLLVSTAEIKGKVGNFTASNLDLTYGQNTHIVGSLSADGLPNAKETFANIRLRPSTINASDIRHFLPKEVYTVAARLGTVELEGRFVGFYEDFVANGSFSTALGSLESDINLKIDDETRSSSYTGYLKTNGFNLGRLVGNTDLLKTISMEGRIAGSGFDLQTARVTLNATIRQLHLLDYNYRNIKANGTLSRQMFTGKVAVNDPNLVINADGVVHLAPNAKAFNLVANLQKADLQGLGFTEKPLAIRAESDLNFKGLRLDDFAGTALFKNAEISYDGNTLALDSVNIISTVDQGTRSLSFVSDLIALQARGDFDYTVLIDDLKQLVHEYTLNFESNDVAIAAYYNQKNSALQQEYRVDYDIYLKRANPLLHLFMPQLTISDFSKIEGSFRHGNTVIFDLFTRIDTVLYDNIALYSNNIELNTSKLQRTPDVLASALITSEEQLLPSVGDTENFYLEGIWSERTINFSTNIAQTGQDNRATISGDLNFLENQVQLVFNRSNITLLDNAWAFTPGNTILISDRGRSILFENFALTNRNQVFNILGLISDNPESILKVNVQDFDLRNLNPLIEQQLRGRLNGELTVQDLYNQAILNSMLQVDSLHFDNVLIGDVVGRSDWNNSQQQLAMDFGISYGGKKVLSVTGNYKPDAPEEQLDMLAVMDNSQLKIVEPILKPIMSNLEGTMEGRIRILGRLNSPVLTGSVMVNNGQFRFDYLGTTYRLTDRVYFGANSISFRNARLTDLYGNTATISGGIAHDGFKNMVLDIQGRYRNFMVLNTTSSQNELYYGTAFATGTASVLGPVDNLQINVTARSNENTRIVLPMDNQTELGQKDFIRFVNRNTTDTTGVAVAVEKQRVNLSGINMNFNLDVTDDAYFEIIIDRQTGDVIRGSGNGLIRMTIDTRGEFNMFGTFEITQGAYNFNLLEGLVSREFRVTPGGTISWNGDPLAGTMRINATYSQQTSLADFAPSGAEVQGSYPVTAVIDLSGPILTPEIKLGLNFDELPQDAQTILSPFISSIKNDENELNRQVFSLLVMQRLAPPGSLGLEGAGTAAVGGSLGSLLSGQLNTFFNSIDSNLQVDIGLGRNTFNQDALSALQVRLSYNFFQGRLRVTSQSGFSNAGGATGTGGTRNQNTYQGDWSLEYYITRSGELRARLEYNTNPSGLTGRALVSQSVSLLHTKRFDTVRELFGRNRASRRERRRLQEQEQIILDSDPRLRL
uniref:translocation/assembly module TamB domain-containing protein n=1 Tax=Pontibacter beigongshangensis TaxID=2574733 RepID=UPI00164EED95|nr:translocation/assembly module TamB domain-containing protein [Pontibacter beigongshangensis]